MGLLGHTVHPDVEDAIRTVAAAARRVGVPCGIVALDADAADRRAAQGFSLIAIAIDVLMIIGSARASLDKVTRDPVPPAFAT
ncbi:MAG: hypothetical protein U0869_21400 [Chloroflexota bacterium]